MRRAQLHINAHKIKDMTENLLGEKGPAKAVQSLHVLMTTATSNIKVTNSKISEHSKPYHYAPNMKPLPITLLLWNGLL